MKFKTTLLLLLAFVVFNSTYANVKKKIKIVGYVTDVNAQPLEGVSIIVDNIQSKTFTNKKGFYKIKVKPEIKTIMAYSLMHGGIKKEFTGESTINFILTSDANNANNISVVDGEIYNTGYGYTSQEDATRSMNKVENKEINTYSTIYDMIEAQVSGVIVRNKSIMIRGLSSFQNQGEPLFVVDGSITYSIDYVNPNHVQSITVLKDAAASIYGVRGTFGVIVITLKK